MPSYFPVPTINSLVTFPSLPSEKYVSRLLPPSASIASQTVLPVFFPPRDAFIPTHRNVSLSNIPPGGLLRITPVNSLLDAVWVLENVMALLMPDQQAV